jgi:hypothetical protein
MAIEDKETQGLNQDVVINDDGNISQETARETHQREVAQTDQRTASLRQKGGIEQEHLEKIGC